MHLKSLIALLKEEVRYFIHLTNPMDFSRVAWDPQLSLLETALPPAPARGILPTAATVLVWSAAGALAKLGKV